jgi:hypothetical protein
MILPWGTGTFPLEVGENFAEIIVYAEDTTVQKTYTVYITRENETGISEVSSHNLKIYPNPVQNTLYIQSSSTIEQINIYDISGRMLQTSEVFKTSEVLDISYLASGIYLVKVKTEEGEIVGKIIKE